jgi:hypothetical protein
MPRVGTQWLLVSLVLCGCGAEATRRSLGAACTTTSDCRVDLICITDDPGGQCTKFCSHDEECGTGNLCDPEGKCYQACNQDSDCPRAASDPRYGCEGAPPRRFCDVADVESSDGGSAD